MPDPAADATASDTTYIGRYRVIGEIGRGGMGVVYRCEDERIRRSVAVKTLSEVTLELRERFYVEARSGILSHPNIVTIYELGEHEGIPFIAMEFLDGESLESMLRTRNRLSLLDALPIVQQLCDGLGYAHSQGLIHRDVKPANVIVLPDGTVKIVDFGIARLSDQKTRLTRTDSLLGTFHYIAPERLKGQPSDGRADLWSAGVILYELVTGALPFRGKNVSALYRMMNEPFTPVDELVPSLPPELTPILDRALAKELDRRYGSADEMAIDLRALANRLTQDRVQDLLSNARQLLAEEHLGRARTLTLQAQRLDPANTTARLLLQELAERLNQMQREEQLRQILEQGDAALADRQFEQAIALFEQAGSLDPDKSAAITARLEQARSSQEQSQRVRALCEEANEARSRGDLSKAHTLLGEAMKLDTRSTSLRQAHALNLRDLQQQEQATRIRELLRSAREAISGQRYTGAIAQLRDAAEIDPTHAEVQQLLLETTSRQRQQRRLAALERVVSEIQDCLDRNDLIRAADRAARALETLPHEPTLLRLRGEIEARSRDQEIEATVRAALLEAQQLFDEQPASAIAVLDVALARASGDPRLLQFRERLAEHLATRTRGEMRRQRLHQAEHALQLSRPDDAIAALELEAAEGGITPDLESLLSRSRLLKQTLAADLKHTQLLEEARRLAQGGEHEQLLGLLGAVPASALDAELSRLRTEAERERQQLASRVEASLARAASMAMQDLSGALRFLRDQPPEIGQSSLVVSRITRLTEEKSQADAVAEALQASRSLLARNDLRGCTRPLERLAAAMGEDHQALQAGRQAVERDRQKAADAALQAVIAHAHHALSSGNPRVALGALKAATAATPFASTGCVKEVALLQQRATAERAASTAERARLRRSSSAASILASFRRPRWAASVAVAFLICCSLVAFLHSRAARPVALSSMTSTSPASGSPSRVATNATASLAINAVPWATVISVQNAQGVAIPLTGGERPTPLRLGHLSPGSYTITLRAPDNTPRQLTCPTAQASDDVCSITLDKPSLEQVLAGVKE